MLPPRHTPHSTNGPRHAPRGDVLDGSGQRIDPWRRRHRVGRDAAAELGIRFVEVDGKVVPAAVLLLAAAPRRWVRRPSAGSGDAVATSGWTRSPGRVPAVAHLALKVLVGVNEVVGTCHSPDSSQVDANSRARRSASPCADRSGTVLGSSIGSASVVTVPRVVVNPSLKPAAPAAAATRSSAFPYG